MSATYIIHTPEDAAVAAKVATHLMQSGADVTNNIVECDAVTLVFSPAATASRTVREEVAYAVWARCPFAWVIAAPASLADFLFLLSTDEMALPEDAQVSSGSPPTNRSLASHTEEDITDMFFTAAELIGHSPGQAIYLLRHLAEIAPDFADGQLDGLSRRISNDHRDHWLELLVTRGTDAISDRDWLQADQIIADIRRLDSEGTQAQDLKDRLRRAQLSQLLPLARTAIDEDHRDTAQRIAEMMLAIDETDAAAQEILATIQHRNESDALYKLASLAHSQGREQATLQLVHQVNRITPDYGDPDELIRNQAISVRTGKIVKLLATLQGHEYPVNALAFIPDGTLMASGSRDNTIRLWEMPEGRQVAVLRRDDGAVRSIVFSPDGSHMASLSGSVIRVWTMPEGHEAVVFDASNRFDNVASLVFSPQGDGLICGHVNGQLSWVRIADGKQLMSSRPHDSSVQGMAIPLSGRHLASCAGKMAKVWRVGEHSLSLDFVFEEDRLVSAVCFSPDETMLATIASSEATTWNLNKGERLFSCEHDPNTLLNAIAFSKDNSTLATGGSEGLTKLWAVSDGGLLNTLEGDRNVNTVVFSPDGRTLAVAAGRDIRLWGLP